METGLANVLAAGKRGGAKGLVLHEPGHFVAIRSADLALLADLAEQEPAQSDRHHFHRIDSMQPGATAGLTAARAIRLRLLRRTTRYARVALLVVQART